MIEAGTSVDGYRVERMIGRGGMGVVYEAVQLSMRRRVALKLLRPELADDPAFVERFRREAQLQASLEHPNVLEVYDVGEADDGLYLAMRLVSGRTLMDVLRDGHLDADRALRLLDQVTGALDSAHEAALIHRDVKPQNVLVDEGDRAFLADFGLTRAGTQTTVASSSPMLGSVAYVAPEIVRGEEPTPASDRYSVAATVFHCITGDVLFPRASDAAVLYAHATEVPPRAQERRAELPEALDDVLGPALAKEPGARPPTAQAIVGGVRDALGTGVGRLGPPRGPAPPSAEPTAVVPPPADGNRRASRLVLGGAALLAAAALGAGVALILDEDESTSAAGDVVPVPTVAAGAVPLGSQLGAPERSVDCVGREPRPDSPACSIVQTELADATLLVPEDGMITGWTVRGAAGDIALDVIRPRGSDTVRVGKSQWESANNAGPHHFDTQLAVEAGDRLGLELGPGASIGITEVAGAQTERWMDPLGGAYGTPDLKSGTGFDYEVALRAEFVAGKTAGLPEHLTGFAARSAPDGLVRDTAPIHVWEPDKTRLDVKLVEVEDRVAVDVFKGRERTLRVFLDDLRPEGVPIEIKTFDYPDTPYGEVGLWWTNPNSGRVIFHGMNVGEGFLESAA
jgi:serine/threonine-protein kinase